MTASSTVYRRRGDVRYRIVAQEAVVVRQSGPEVLVLNEVGARVLELVDGATPVEALVARVQGEFEGEALRIESDVLRFLAELADAGVLEPVQGAA